MPSRRAIIDRAATFTKFCTIKGMGDVIFLIRTGGPNDNVTVHPGDWIITGVNGEKYPCRPDIFEKTYEPA